MVERAVFLDRDGVLNESELVGGAPRPPARPEDFRLLPGVEEACRALRGAGFALLVVTNQPDVARGALTREAVERVNALLSARLPVDEVLTCFHDDADACGCRKPRAGLLLEAASRRGLDLGRSYMVGDRWKDVEAGRAAGCRSVLIERDYSERRRCRPDWIARDLPDAVRIILQQEAAP